MFFKIKVIKENVFAWLQDIQANILAHNDDQNISEQMQQLILKNISSFIEMNAESTVKLCGQWFEGDYYQIVQAINKYTPSKSKACFFPIAGVSTNSPFSQCRAGAVTSRMLISGLKLVAKAWP